VRILIVLWTCLLLAVLCFTDPAVSAGPEATDAVSVVAAR
jgi:hypothetical protein